MAQNYFAPLASEKRLGTHPVFTQAPAFGTVTANVTNNLPGTGLHRKAVLARLSVNLKTKPVDADGTVILRIVKRKASSDTETVLTQDFDLEGFTTVDETQALSFVTTLVDADFDFDEGDSIFPRVVSNSAAIDTQAVGVQIQAEFLLRR